MKKILLSTLIVASLLDAWEINTHRAINRKAIENSVNLKTFVTNSGIKNINYSNEEFEGYGNYTYLNYVKNGELNGISTEGWKQNFDGNRPSYQKLIEAGSILEDAQWPHESSLFDWQDRADGRFVNHFYDAQNSGLGLLFFGQRYQNALLWGVYGIKKDVPVSIVSTSSKDNDYSYKLALEYFKKGFTSPDPAERKRNQAKMFVSLGHFMHLMNDMTSPAHTRGDAHPDGDNMEICGQGGKGGDEDKGYRIGKDNTLYDYLGIDENKASNMTKYTKASDFISKEAYWASTLFFSEDSIYTKPKPSISDTYESFASSHDGIDKYYIRSYGTGTSRCRNGCVPSGTKLAIRIKSYIISELVGGKYYTNTQNHIILDKSTSFQGDNIVFKETAKILIPRAISNARNFTNYFFRGQISAKIDGSNITIKNISDPSLVKDGYTATLKAHDNYFHLKYTTSHDDTLRDFTFRRDADRYKPVIAHIGPLDAVFTGGFTSLIDLAPGESIVVAIKRDTSITSKNIVVVYDGKIGTERGLAVSAVQTPDIMAN